MRNVEEGAGGGESQHSSQARAEQSRGRTGREAWAEVEVWVFCGGGAAGA